MHVLLVENDAMLAGSVMETMRCAGHAIDCVRDRREAELSLRDGSYDLIVLDLGLPGKDGLEVLAEARRAHVNTPVIVMTARDALEARVRGLDAGADDYLVKPFHVDELSARIRSLTRRAQGLAANRIDVGVISLDIGTCDGYFVG